MCYDNRTMKVSFAQTWHTPVFSSLLANRRDGLIVLGAVALYLGLSLAGLPVWRCPIRAALGIPCPGCGLTEAVMLLLRGDIVSSLKTHAFAPIFLFALLLMSTVLVLPESKRHDVIMKVARFESRSGVTAWVLSFLMLYWAFRLIA